MREHDYDDLPPHKEDHERLLDEIHAMIEDYEDGIYVDLDRFSRTLEAWFGQHFSTHDARLHRQLG